MLKFENIDELVCYMFRKLNNSDPVSVVADKDFAVELMKELLSFDNVILDFCGIDDFEYDREYLVSLCDEVDTDYWHVTVEQLYNYNTDEYRTTSGFVLFHEAANSKAQSDMQQNEFNELTGFDWFKFGEDNGENVNNSEIELSTNEENDTHGFTVSKSDENGCFSYSFYTSEKLDKSEILEMIRSIGF